jgi:hypothetical protein
MKARNERRLSLVVRRGAVEPPFGAQPGDVLAGHPIASRLGLGQRTEAEDTSRIGAGRYGPVTCAVTDETLEGLSAWRKDG